MQISDFLSQLNSGTQTTNNALKTSQTGSGSSIESVKNSMPEGTVFEGSVSDIKDGLVTISLDNGKTMSARLDSSVSLTQGQSVFFQVKSNDGQTIMLKPVSLDGLLGNPTLDKALNAANLPINEKSLNMVNTMMKEGMSIDQESLLKMNRLITLNPTADVDTIVNMKNLGILVNDANVSMYEAYSNNQARILDNMADLTKDASAMLADKSIDADSTKQLALNIFDIVLEDDGNKGQNANVLGQNSNVLSDGQPIVFSEATFNGRTDSSQPDVNPSQSEINLNESAINSNQSAINLNQSEINSNQSEINSNQSVLNLNQSEINSVSNLNNNGTTNISNDGQNTSDILLNGQNPDVENDSINNNQKSISLILNDKQFTGLSDRLSNLNGFKEIAPELFDEQGQLKDDLSSKDILSSLRTYVSGQSSSTEQLKDLFSTNAFKKILTDGLSDKWSLKTDDIVKPDEIKKLYEKILNDTEKIAQAALKMSEKGEALSKSAATIKNNVSFMNQMNDLYTFVQIPVKLTDQTTNSELYVYRNKKNSDEAEDELTAFLRFDMEHLGRTDIFVKMKENFVTCDWKLESDESLNVIADNLDLLEERLKAKGYNCTMTLEKQKEEESFDFTTDFLKADDTSVDMVHRYSFDVKA